MTEAHAWRPAPVGAGTMGAGIAQIFARPDTVRLQAQAQTLKRPAGTSA
jgi:3-hydroxyacyl-CoA dehydrogenase